MKSRSLLVQVLAVNLLLVAGTVLLLTLAVNDHSAGAGRGRDALVFGLAITATVLGNWLLLRRRFVPLAELISAMERIDLAVGREPLSLPYRMDSAEVRRLEAAFTRMVARLEAERRAAAGAAVQAQERERRRIAQDLHDEVNQALTAVSLRLQASVEHAPEPLRAELRARFGIEVSAAQARTALLVAEWRRMVLGPGGVTIGRQLCLVVGNDQIGLRSLPALRRDGDQLLPRATDLQLELHEHDLGI